MAVRAMITNSTIANKNARYMEQRFGVPFLATTRATSTDRNFATQDGQNQRQQEKMRCIKKTHNNQLS